MARYNYNINDPLDRSEILARADAEAKSRTRKPGNVAEIAACARACRAYPDHAGNWEQLLEELSK